MGALKTLNQSKYVAFLLLGAVIVLTRMPMNQQRMQHGLSIPTKQGSIVSRGSMNHQTAAEVENQRVSIQQKDANQNIPDDV